MKEVTEARPQSILSASVRMMTRDGYSLVGEGDDGISASHLSEPVSKFPVLPSIQTNC